MTQFNTILLDQGLWDTITDASRNIALASPAYSLAQDVASAIKLFFGEAYYQTSEGVPYYAVILGLSPPLAVFKAQMVAAALTVPGVVSAVCYVTNYTNRAIVGQCQFTDDTHQTQVVAF